MSEVYIIDATLLGNVKKRMFTRLAIVFTIAILIVFAPQLINFDTTDFKSLGITLVFIVVVFIFSAQKTVTRKINALETLKIILDDEGVSAKAEGSPSKRIAWNNLQIDQKPKAVIILNDTNVSKFNKYLFRTGAIRIPQELINRENLLEAIKTKLAITIQN